MKIFITILFTYVFAFQAMEDLLWQAIDEVFPQPVAQFELVIKDLTPPIDPTDVSNLRVAVPPRKKLGRQNIWFELEERSGRMKKFPLSVKIFLNAEIWVAAENMARHCPVKNANFNRETRRLDRQFSEIFFATEELPADFRTRQRIPTGKILLRRMLEETPVLDFGSEIEVAFRGQAFELRMDGVSRGKGGIGDKVSVLVKATNRKLKGTIESKHLVVVEEK